MAGQSAAACQNRSNLRSGLTWNIDVLKAPLRAFFQGFSVLYVTDTMLLQPFPFSDNTFSPGYHNDTETFAPRVFAPCWYLNTELRPTQRLTSPLFGRGSTGSEMTSTFLTDGITRFTALRGLLVEVRCLDCRAASSRIPDRGFRLVDLNDITLRPPYVPPYTLDDNTDRVDGVLSCALSYECISPRSDRSIFCSTHHKRLCKLVL